MGVPTTTTQRIALVTGAGSGIGQAVARELLQNGWAVVLAGRRLVTLQTAAQGHDLAYCIPTDVTVANDVLALFDVIAQRFGRLDLLFNNAGFAPASLPFDELPLVAWQQTVDVNLTGSFMCAQQAFRLMKRQNPRGGRIINNGSIAAHVPRPNSAAYTATKHAITGLTRSISLDGRAYDIACGQIDVGNAATELAMGLTKANPQAEPMIDVALVAQSVRHMADLPLEANVQFMTVMATKMPYIGRG